MTIFFLHTKKSCNETEKFELFTNRYVKKKNLLTVFGQVLMTIVLTICTDYCEKVIHLYIDNFTLCMVLAIQSMFKCKHW